ncbi:hypothetical protein F5Y11DRAFT_368065 [Daldinia sp. FL1419]|nr:hypothetical protein F5Y11DRAFT_368065 [Daldinia sp. FL1419]
MPTQWIPRRCGLCQFDFSIGTDLIPICCTDGKLFSPFLYETRFISDGQFTSHNPITVCDLECVKFLVFKPRGFLQATAYAFEPSFYERQRRFAWLRLQLASHINLPRPYLPMELRNEIAQYLLREYSITRAAKNWLTFRVPIDIYVDISTKIWARYIEFEGIKYLATLSNKPCDDGILLIGNSISEIHNIYISEDHLGIRQIYFTYPTHASITPSSGIWWRTLPRPYSDVKLHGKTDGLKLRDLAWSQASRTPTPRRIAWDIPRLPTSVVRHYSLGGTAHRMASVPYNTPAVIAYSFCWNRQLISIYAHIAGEDSLLYKSTSTDRTGDIWLYMPINSGEYITEIWMRHRQLARELALIVRTNIGRIMVTGPQPKKSWPPCTWTLLDTPENLPNRLFFEDSPSGIQELGFETCLPTPQKCAAVPIPASPYPESTSLEDYFYTSASLEGVVAVTPCRVKQANIFIFTGMLLHYANGYENAVGQVRFDCLDDIFRVDSSETLTLGFLTMGGCPYVANIQLSPPKKDNMVYLNIPRHGWIEWWFSYRQCKVYCNGKASMPTIF